MSDEPTQSGDQSEETPDLQAMLKQFQSELKADSDKRFQGFQGLLDRRDAEYRAMLEDLKTADLEPEQQEQAKANKLQRERDEYKRQVEILSMRKDYPEEVDVLMQFLQGKTLPDQLELLRQFRKAAAPTAESSTEEHVEEQPTPVDRNNAARKSSTLLDAASNMTKDKANTLLNQSNEPGFLSRLRGNRS